MILRRFYASRISHDFFPIAVFYSLAVIFLLPVYAENQTALDFFTYGA